MFGKQSILQTIYNLILLFSSGMSYVQSFFLSTYFYAKEHQCFHSIEWDAAVAAVYERMRLKLVMMMTTTIQNVFVFVLDFSVCLFLIRFYSSKYYLLVQSGKKCREENTKLTK